MKATELRAQRRQTTAYINGDLVMITLKRSERTTTAAGGSKLGTAEDLAPQAFHMPTPMTSPNSQVSQTQEGPMERGDWRLVGFWDTDIKKHDTFELNNRWYEVVAILATTEYETIAGLKERDGSS